MDGPEYPRTGSGEGNSEKRDAGTERAPTIVSFESKKLLWTTFGLIFCNRLVLLLVDGILLSLVPQITPSVFGPAPGVLSVLPTVIAISSGVLRLPMATFIDRCPRGLGFSLAWFTSQLSLVILVYDSSLAGKAAGFVLYGVGSSGMDFILTVILADMTSLKNRGLIYGIYAAPLILKPLAAPYVAQWLQSFTVGFCAITTCALCFPLNLLFARAQARLGAQDEHGDTTTTPEEKPRILDRLRRFFVELDTPGITLAIAGLCLLLLAPTHFPGTQEGWSLGIFSAALVLGFLSITSLFVWEHYLNPARYFPGSLIRDRNLLGGCVVVMLTATSIACWSSHVSSYLRVVDEQTVAAAGRVVATRTIAFACSAPFIGLFIRQTGNYKYPAGLAGACLAVLTTVHLFTSDIKGAWACFLICIGITESVLTICSQMAIMASVDHKNIAMALGIWGAFLSIAAAIGSSVATAVWTNGLPHILKKTLPPNGENYTFRLLSSLEKKKQYSLEGPIRATLVAACEVTQQHLLVTSLCIAVLALACVFKWEKIDIRERQDVPGEGARGVVW